MKYLRNLFAFQVDSYKIMGFTNDLLCWYSENKRDLPWRRVSNPYLVWVSEIILQQTRITIIYHLPITIYHCIDK